MAQIAEKQQPVILIFSDFGTADGRAAKLTGNVLRTDPTLEVCLAQHSFPKGDIAGAAAALSSFVAYYPVGTICLALVEAQEGTARPVAVRTRDDKIFLVPDNGLLTVWEDSFGLAEAVAIDAARCPSDVNPYAHCAGLLASGKSTLQDLGTPIPLESLVRLARVPIAVEQGLVRCGIQSVVRAFGNLNLTVPIDRFETAGIVFGDRVRIRIERQEETLFDEAVVYVRTFGEVAEGEPLLYNGSSGYMGMSRNLHSFVSKWLPTLEDGDGVENYTVTIEAISASKSM